MDSLSEKASKLQLYLIAVPVVVLLGYFLAQSADGEKVLLVGGLVGLLALPIFLKWHQVCVVASVNLAVNAFFLPGQPPLWVPLAFGSLALTLLAAVMSPNVRLIHQRQLTFSLLFLLAVILVTASITGGIGARALGSDTWGGKRYLSSIGAIAAFFAISARPIAARLRTRAATLYTLSGTSAALSNMVVFLGPGFYFLYLIFPQEMAAHQFSNSAITRFTGVSWLSLSVLHFLLMRYGLAGILKFEHPWRVILFVGFFLLSFVGGFRSVLLMVALLLIAQFVFERMFTARYVIAAVLAVTIGGVIVVAFANKMPLNIQRALSILPLELDARAEKDALGTLDWRLEMWRVVVPEIPKYLLVGKGYSYSGADAVLTRLGHQRGIVRDSYEDTLISGNYHHGVLTVLIPFGIWGFGGFLAFCVFGLRVLYRNYLYGAVEMRTINTFFLSFFLSRFLFYIFFYGQFDLDLILFTSVVALSIAVNGGMASPPEAQERMRSSELRLGATAHLSSEDR